MDLSVFRSRRTLDAMAVASVGVSLAAATGAVFRAMFGSSMGPIEFIVVFPTLLLGTLWAVLLRWRATLPRSSVRVGWVLSVPLAALNGALASGLMFAFDSGGGSLLGRFLGGMVLGATFGAVFWGPGLLATLLLFGVPIARAQRLAAQGLAGQERGDGFVGGASASIAAMALVSTLLSTQHTRYLWVLQDIAFLGVVVGLVTFAISLWRERLRRDFIADVVLGRVPHFRVDSTQEGMVLVRVVSQGEGYRVADYAEEVARLDTEGAVTKGRSDGT